jgi:hypothetical protein
MDENPVARLSTQTYLRGAAAPAPDRRSAVHEELADVPETALAIIHGRMLFAIRVTVPTPPEPAVHLT